ncbi:MAG: YciI family protein [Verrucomicrobiae bacterium]|nr:YciI family protein [Verrucomicrobiae bacterium]
MKYMLLIYGAEDVWTDEERNACMLESMQISEELAAQGKCLGSSPLHSVELATSLRIRDGARQITDGPFAETTEQLGGFYLLDVDNLDEAIAIASRLPPAKKGTVEIRPLMPLPEREVAQSAKAES